ncbi:MAG: hypothetical protein HUU02_08555 [Bacteroidetes bacterium]|nr:hypothetical protein [Bacteroidota bacterium]
MPIVAVENAPEGATVISAVKDATGRVLMNAGSVLTSRHAEALMKYGIHEIEIAVTDGLITDPADDARFAETAKLLDPMFVRNDREWDVMAAIHAAAVRLRMESEEGMEQSSGEGGER